MKKLLAIALTFTATTAFATEEFNPHEICKNISTLAESIMTYRQEGVSVVTMMENAEVDNAVVRLFVEKAYKKPRHHSEEYQRQAISDFRDEYYIQCLKALEM